ncbi:MAG: sigma-70 family RNA polymerase sigma factor [Calditrichaeota bacterium]|nr:sigma-70 family RNA polymerase sigma factor [Calditrichota bacterium]
MTTLSDSEIIVRCQSGDKNAYGVLVKRYMKKAYYSALGFMHEHEAALDLSQEAFVKAWRGIKSVDHNRSFFTWYYTILKNLCLNELRNLKNRAKNFSEIGTLKEDIINESHLLPYEQKELQEQVWQAINQLQSGEREIIIMREFQDLSYNEMAEILDCPIGTIMSRLYSARKALKQKLNKVLERDH